VKVSIYGTVFNNGSIIQRSLLTLFNQMNKFFDDWEVIIVDNFSSDGTWETLKKMKKRYDNIKLIRVKCTRGRGRQIALQNTTGKYVFSVDFDHIFENGFGKLISKEIKKCGKNDLIYPYAVARRSTAIKIGWRNLNVGEDTDFSRGALIKKINVKSILIYPFSLNEKMNQFEREKRYANGFKFMIRKFKNLVDLTRIRGGKQDEVLRALGITIIKRKINFFYKIISFLGIPIIFSISLFGLGNGKIIRNIVHIYPEEIGFPSRYFLTTFNITSSAYKAIELIKKFRSKYEDVKIKEVDGIKYVYLDEGILRRVIM